MTASFSFRWAVILLAVGRLLTADAGSQTRPAALSQPAPDSGRRLALVIGNEAYSNQPLKNPGNDARDMQLALTEAGFRVDVVTDADFREMNTAIDRFIAAIAPNDVALFYYSGHGIQIEGENYLLPIDFVARDESDARYTSYSASRVLDRMTGTGARMKVLVLDACRSNPFRVSRDARGGLAAMSSSGRGSLIAFAAGPGGTADDNVAGSNGLFTRELLRAMRERGLGIEQVFSRVRSAVDEASGGRQTPWTNSSLIGDFYFQPPLVLSASTAAPSRPAISSSSTALPSSAVAILRGNDLAKSFNWSGGPLDLKVPGAEAAARSEIELFLKRLTGRLDATVAFFEASGIVWSEPSLDLTNYVTTESSRAGTAAPARPQADITPTVKLAYIDLQRLADASTLGKTLRAQVVAGGSTAEQQQAAMDTFQRALTPLLEPVARARGLQMLFQSTTSALAYADETLNITADFIAALDDPNYLKTRPSVSAAGSSAVSGLRYVTLQEIVNRSRIGREFTAQGQQAMARNPSQDEIARVQARLQEDFQRVLAPVLDRSARAAGVRVLLSSADSGLIWSERALDLTDVIVRDLDAAPSAAGFSTFPLAASPVPAPPPLPPSGPVRIGGDIREPTKLKDVLPEYPAIAQSARVQGLVIIEAEIGPQGNVTGAKVLSSPSPLLDIPALAAVRQWQYTPTLFNGVPVPVIMTVTVKFSLQ